MRSEANWTRVLLFIFLMVLTIVFFTGCIPEQDKEKEFNLPEIPPALPEPGTVRTGLLCYTDRQHRFLIPVHREIPESETIIRCTLEKLIATPQLEIELEPLGLVPLLPAKTVILGIHLGEMGLARVDFNGSFLEYSSSAERLVLGGLLFTLHQFSEIERLEIMIHGHIPEKLPGGTPGGISLGPECLLNLEIDDALEDYRNFTAVTVFFCFPTPQGRALYVPVTRVLQPVENSPTATVEELLSGARSGSGLFSSIPSGTTLRGLKLEEGLLIVDLSGELLTYEGGLAGAENMLNQILLTMARLKGVEGVQILVEGKKIILPEGIDLTAPLEPPVVYNFF